MRDADQKRSGSLEMDLFRLGSRINKGFFLSIKHYVSTTEAMLIAPQSLSLLRRISNLAFVRYGLIKTSILIQRNIPWKLKVLLNSLPGHAKSNRVVTNSE
jgi:hypothetical protein